MKNSKNNLLIILLIVMTGAWATPVFSVDVPEAKPDEALIVFYRVKKFAGAGIPVGVHYSGGSVGTLSNGASFHKYFNPGEYTFWSKVITESSVTLNVTAGETYYIRGDVTMGLVVGRPKLTQTYKIESR